MLRSFVFILACALPIVGNAGDNKLSAPSVLEDGLQLKLPLPTNYRAGTALFIQVQAGKLGAGHALELRGEDGTLLGTISPYGVHNRAAGLYTFPLTANPAQAGVIKLRVLLTSHDQNPRAPSTEELKAVNLVSHIASTSEKN
jgi:hypothetical protein